MVILAHKIALNPTRRQERLLWEHVGYARFAANRAIEDFREGLADGEWRNDKTLRPRWNASKAELAPWAAHLSQNAAKNAIRNVGKAVSRWGEYRRAQREGRPARYVGFPRWRKRGVHDSYQADNGRGTVRVCGRSVRLPRIGRVKMREELRFEGEITTVVVSNDGIRWYAAIGVDTKTAPPPKRQGDAVGIDMGVRTLASLSDGTTFENPRVLTSALSALRRVDKAIARSRNTHGHNRRSVRRQRMYERRRRLHARVTHLRHDFQHKATTAIAKRYARIGVETLNISGMMRNHRLSRAVADAGMGSFISMLEYKSELHGAEIAKIDRWYASSKVCSGCGNRKAELSLSMREYRCHMCGLVMDRDENAARNIETEAARSADSLNGRGDEVRPGHIVPSAAAVKRLLELSGLPARLERISAD